MVDGRMGLIAGDPSQLRGIRKGDPIGAVLLRTTFLDMPRADGARRVAGAVRRVAPDAALYPYAWHFLTHERGDGLAARSTRKLGTGPEDGLFGHLRENAACERAWEATARALEAMDARGLVVRTPPSFSPSLPNRERLQRWIRRWTEAGLEVIWEADGIWGDEELAILAAEMGCVSLQGRRARDIEPDGGPSAVWARIDAVGSDADLVGDAVRDGATVVFSGAEALRNLRRSASA